MWMSGDDLGWWLLWLITWIGTLAVVGGVIYGIYRTAMWVIGLF